MFFIDDIALKTNCNGCYTVNECSYGFHFNYSALLPHAILLLRRMPVIGHILNAPGIKIVSLLIIILYGVMLMLLFCDSIGSEQNI